MQDIIALTGVSVGRGVNNRRYQSKEYAGSCPFPGCHCTDSFHLYPDVNDVPGIGTLGYFLCMDGQRGGRNGCGRSGDSISFLQQMYGKTFEEACIELGIDPLALMNYRLQQRGQAPTTALKKRFLRERALAETSEQWRTTALAFARSASAQLTGEPLEYLLSRGLSTRAIKNNLLGFYPEYKFVKASLWGGEPDKKLLLRRGIVIPWFNARNEVICLRIRRLPGDESAEAQQYYGIDKKTGEIGRYRAIYGSASAFLYHTELVSSGCNVAMFEGELDALIAGDAIGLQAVCVATGSTGWGRSEETKRLLSQAEQVLICFDNDTNLAGDRAAEYWLDELSHARRWRPLWSDANDMVRDGVDLGEWLEIGLAPTVAETVTVLPETELAGELQPVSEPADLEPEAMDIPQQCADCGAHITQEDREFFYWETSACQAYCYCAVCRDPETGEPRPVVLPAEEEEEEQDVSQDGEEAEQITAPAHQLAPEAIAAAFTNALPEWDITIMPGAPTYGLPAKEEAQEEDFWQRTARQIAEPPRYHVPVLDKHGQPMRAKSTPIYNDEGKQIGVQPGNIIFKLAGPMMSREEWATLRAEQLAWRPDPALTAHYAKKQ